MHLRVEIGEKKEIYSFPGKSSIRIGRSSSCDVRLVNEGISRVHVEIKESNGSFEVVDLGSTNGSFMNEEKLELNTSYPFNTFFPVKLGHSVFIYLVDMQESEVVGETFSQNTTTTSFNNNSPLDEGNKTLTRQLKIDQTNEIKVSGRPSPNTGKTYNTRRRKKLSTKPEGRSQFRTTVAFVVIIFFGFMAYETQDKWMSLIIPETPVVKRPVKKQVVRKVASVKKQSKTDIAANKLKMAMNSIKTDKCLDSGVSEICSLLKSTKSRNYYEGAIVKNDTLYIVIDVKSSYQYYQKNIKKYNKSKEEQIINTLMRNPMYMQRIVDLKREKKNINVYDFRPDLNRLDYKQLSDVAILAELLFSPLRKKLLNSKFSKINITTYQLVGSQYQYLDHWYFEKDFLKFEGYNLEDVEFYLQTALFHADLSTFNLYRSYLKPKK